MKTNNTNLIQTLVDSIIFFILLVKHPQAKLSYRIKTADFATANNKFEGTKI